MAALPLDLNPITDPVLWLLSSVGSNLTELAAGLHGVVVEILPLLAPHQSLGSAVEMDPVVQFVQCGSPGSVACRLEGANGTLQLAGRILLGVVLLARVARLGASGRLRSPHHLLFDLVPRIIGGWAATQFVGAAITLAVKVAAAAAIILATAILQTAGVEGTQSLTRRLDNGAFRLAGSGGLVYLTLGFLYVMIQVVGVAVALMALVAPVVAPLLFAGEEGKAGTAWFRALTSCLMILVAAPVGVALSTLLGLLLGAGGLGGTVGGALACEAALVVTSIACLALGRSALQQTRDSLKLSFEAVHLSQVGELSGQMADEVRRGIRTGARLARSVGSSAAGVPPLPPAPGKG